MAKGSIFPYHCRQMDALMKKILSLVLITILTVFSTSFVMAQGGETGTGGVPAPVGGAPLPAPGAETPGPAPVGTTNNGTAVEGTLSGGTVVGGTVVGGTVTGGTVVGGTTTGGTTPPANDCGPIQQQMTTASDVNLAAQPIVAYLTENFENIQIGGVRINMTCGRIIECLRNDQRFTSRERPIPSSVQEYTINQTLITKFPACVVSGTDGLSLLNNYASRVYQWIAGIVGAICILIIIVSGIQISIGGLSADEVGSAKERVERALIGLAVLFLSAFILYTINPTFFT